MLASVGIDATGQLVHVGGSASCHNTRIRAGCTYPTPALELGLPPATGERATPVRGLSAVTAFVGRRIQPGFTLTMRREAGVPRC